MPAESLESKLVIDDLMPRKAFERRFAFIEDDTLRKNISIAFEYVIFLLDTAGKDGIKGLIVSSLYKDALLYTGTIVEACLVHTVLMYLEKNKRTKSKLLNHTWKEESHGVIHAFSKKRRIRYVTEHLAADEIKRSTNFVEINRACRRGGILSKKEFEIAEEIREARNKIHVSGLKNIDNTYSKESLDSFFAKTTKIITKVEKKLDSLKEA